MKPRQMIILLLVMALIDDLISLCFPVNFQFQGYSFVPHFFFFFLMLLIYERGWLDRVLISGFCGVLTDLFFSGTLPVYFIIYAGLGYLSGIFNKAMEEDSRIRFFSLFVLVLLLDLIPFLVNLVFQSMNVSFMTWFMHHELLTLTLHGVLILMMMYILDVLKRFALIRQHRKQLDQRKKYVKMKTQK